MSEPWPGDLAGLLAFSSSLLSLSCRGPTRPAPPAPCATDIEGPLLCTIIELPLPCTAMDCELQAAQAYCQHKAFQTAAAAYNIVLHWLDHGSHMQNGLS